MPQADVPDLSAVEHGLFTARIESLHHWDMLVFLSRHQTSLLSAEHMACLLGSATGEVGDLQKMRTAIYAGNG